MQIEQIQSLAKNDLEAVVATIAEQFGSDVAMIKEISQHITSGGGKKLRPLLAILSANAFGYSGKDHILIGAIVELIHTATLLHDDVVDHSSMRRGKKTANVLFGNEASVLVGDYLYSRSFQMMVQINDMRIMKILADASNIIAEGEVMQLVNCNDPATDENKYLDTILRKTATLFSAASQLGALIAGKDESTCQAMAAYGTHLGMAFQLVDDALDYGSSEQDIGKNIGDDLAEGKPTLPLIHILQTGDQEQVTLVKEAITQASNSNLSAIQNAIEATNALGYTLDAARKQADLAIDKLATVPDSPYKQALIGLANFAVSREF